MLIQTCRVPLIEVSARVARALQIGLGLTSIPWCAEAKAQQQIDAASVLRQAAVTPDRTLVGTTLLSPSTQNPDTPVRLAWKYQNERLVPAVNPTTAPPKAQATQPRIRFQPAPVWAAALPLPTGSVVPDVMAEPVMDTSRPPLSATIKPGR